MIYLAIQILPWMLGAFFLGLVTGWWMKKSLWTTSSINANADDVQSQHYDVELADMQNRLREKHQKIESLQHQLAQLQSSAIDSSGSVLPDDSDDLKKIFGIGKIIENKLNAIGITKFEHVAKLSVKDVNQIAKKLDTFRDRIDRDHWIASAKKCHFEKYGEKV